MYFMQHDGSTFKASLAFDPYFFIGLRGDKHFGEVEQWLRRKHEKHISQVETVLKEDLEVKNHLTGIKKPYLRISFHTVQGLLAVRNDLLPLIEKNKQRLNLSEIYEQ
jgi:DNA polymerase epsilon subunit 1